MSAPVIAIAGATGDLGARIVAQLVARRADVRALVRPDLPERELAAVLSTVTGERYRTLRAGGMGTLGLMIRVAKLVAPGHDVPLPPWQGMQYLRDMFSGRAQLAPLDNARYGDIAWTSVRAQLSARQVAESGAVSAAAA